MRSNPSSSKNLVVKAAVRKFLSATLSSPKSWSQKAIVPNLKLHYCIKNWKIFLIVIRCKSIKQHRLYRIRVGISSKF